MRDLKHLLKLSQRYETYFNTPCCKAMQRGRKNLTDEWGDKDALLENTDAEGDLGMHMSNGLHKLFVHCRQLMVLLHF